MPNKSTSLPVELPNSLVKDLPSIMKIMPNIWTSLPVDLPNLHVKDVPSVKQIMPNKWTNLPVELSTSHVKDLPSVMQALKLELKNLPTHLRYVYLREDETLQVFITNNLTAVHEEKLLRVLREHKIAIAWTLANIKGINLTLCMHIILFNSDAKPMRKPRYKLNPAMKEIIMKEILKLLD